MEESISQQPATQPSPKEVGFVDKYFGGVILKFNSLTKNLSPRNKKFLAYALIVLVGFIFLVLVLAILAAGSKRRTQTPTRPTPTPISGNFTPIENPSRYASDEGVLSIETKIKDIDSQIQDTDLANSTLQPPELDFAVEF